MDQPTKGELRTPGFNTLAIHAGPARSTTGARVTPIYQTTSFVSTMSTRRRAGSGCKLRNIYSRHQSTCACSRNVVAALEGGNPAASPVASGHAAQAVVFHTLLKPGDEFIARRSSTALDHQFQSRLQEFRLERGVGRADDIRASRAPSRQDQGDLHRVDCQSRRLITDIEAIGNVRAAPAFRYRRQYARTRTCKPFSARRRHYRHSADEISRWSRQLDRRRHRRRRHFNGRARGRYPMLSRRGLISGIPARTFGNFAFAIACRVFGIARHCPALSPFNAF